MKKVARLSVLAGVLSAAVAISVGLAPTASAVSSGTYSLIDKYGMCLGSSGGNTDVAATLGFCYNRGDQLWNLVAQDIDGGGTYYRIVNLSGQCLGINGASQSEGAQGMVWDCNGNADQLWYYQQGGDGLGGLVNHNSGMCLGSVNGNSSPGTTLIQWPCNGNPDQLWMQKGAAG